MVSTTYCRMIGSLASYIEDVARREEGNVYGKCLNMFIRSTLADKLWQPFRSIAYNPLMTLLGTLVVYIVILLVYIPLLLISYLIPPICIIAILIFLIWLLGTYIARIIAFPGSTKALQKDYSADFLKRLLSQFENILKLIEQYSSNISLIFNNRVVKEKDIASIKKQCINIVIIIKGTTNDYNGLMQVSEWLKSCLVTLNDDKDKNKITVEELRDIEFLSNSVDTLCKATLELEQLCSTSGPGPVSANNPLVVAASKCLSACQNLKQIITNNTRLTEAQCFCTPLTSVTKLFFNSGPSGLEKVSFPLMREQLHSFYGAERVQIYGCDANLIDTIIIPSVSQLNMTRSIQKENSNNSNSSTTTTTTAFQSSSSSIGTVLFCSPNAGLYECVSQANKDHSWLGFYTNIGFDVCLYNYRGYNESSLTPTPDKLKSDGETVMKYLRQVRGVTSIIIHGESIGGMIGCHIANVCGADMLICDRSFASLDSVASRLLGSWASHGLRGLTFWKTDVVTDYINSKCHKIVLQDPNDEVIAHCASLKNGIATRLILNDSLWLPITTPKIYAIADYLDEPVPCNDIDMIIENANHYNRPLKEEFIAHLMACILDICKKYKKQKKQKRNNDDVIVVDNDQDNMENGNNREQGNSNDSNDDNRPKEKIMDIIGKSIDDSSLCSYEKVWISLLRLDGGIGQLLGGALNSGYDSFRSWICAYIIWGSRSILDKNIPQFRCTLSQCINDLTTITEKLHIELHNDSSLSFIRQALPILLQRNNDNNNNNNNNNDDDDNIGTLISLHSGHNGWPHYHDIKSLENLIKEKLSLKV